MNIEFVIQAKPQDFVKWHDMEKHSDIDTAIRMLAAYTGRSDETESWRLIRRTFEETEIKAG